MLVERLQLTRIAQAGFVLRGDGTTLVVDAFLSPRPDRLVPPRVAPGTLTGVDAILATHEHRDHLDLPALPGMLAASPGANVIVPAPITDRVAEIAGSRVVPAFVDQELVVGAARIFPVPACHGKEMADAYSFGWEISGGLYRFLGYVVELAGVRVYHAGDTIAYEGMAERLRDLRIDLALLPINGRTAEREARGLVGNLGAAEAADVAAGSGATAMVPMHHDTIDGNTGSVAELRANVAARHPEVEIIEVAPFAGLTWPR